MTESAFVCEHCQLPIAAEQLVSDRVDDQVHHFCCRGCLGAFRIISGAGLERFYRQRDWDRPGTAEGAFETGFHPELLEQLVQRGEQGNELTFLIEGIRCASCVWLNEKILQDLAGVLEARINYGSHRARLDFHRNGARINRNLLLNL